ncbi:MFS transporter [Larsenimonas rhizosphaerae]|uniref:MFS transporter n=1 Tax=Larsenimonas rhizosphaerae TaxID=2944682 RepID=A0AA42CXL5_9GAMM|nr:MFS transporter [Larsenimonas rhizosphaerae]MCX2524015.1 MFS transporter [Larsenimonas rhizosphaerae]
MLSRREKLSFGAGDFAFAFTWASLSLYLMYFYTDVFGISPAVVGTLFLVTRLWDAITDPIVGVLSDRTRSRFGRLRPWLLFSALPLGIILALTFTTPALSESGKVTYAFVTYIALMGVYTMANIPYSALPVIMTTDNTERRDLSNIRVICSYVAFVLISYSTLPLVRWFGGGDEALGFSLVFSLYGVMTFAVLLVTFRGVNERHTEGESASSPLTSFRDVARAKPFWLMFLVCVLIFTLMLMPDSVTIYFFKYYLHDEEGVSLFLACGYAAVIAGVLINQYVLQRFCKRTVMIWANLGYALALAAFFKAVEINTPTFVAVFMLAKVFNGIIGATMWAMVADIADYVEYRSGRRATGASTSAVTFSHKFGMSIGGLLVGLLFSTFGYVPNADQTPEVLTLIKSMMSLIPAAGALCVALIMLRYPLSDQVMETVRAQKPTAA